MKLEVGMYVRTEIFGHIGKYLRNDKEIPFSYIVIVDDKNCEYTIPKEIIKVASHNIIDLIEVGDYVNGFPVIHKENDILKCGLLVQFKENEIKSIVTKEQFEIMKYSLEG